MSSLVDTQNEFAPIVPNPGSESNTANFVGHEAEIARAIDMMKAGQKMVLTDPRRMGKTFWMIALAERLKRDHGYRVVLIDYMGVDTTQEFLLKTVRALVASQKLSRKFVAFLKIWFDNVDITLSKGPVTLKKAAQNIDPLLLLEQVLNQLSVDATKHAKPPYVIMMDEVPDAVLGVAEQGANPTDGKNLLQRLRGLRQDTPGIRWILAGSVGFHHVWTICGANDSVINDLDQIDFGPLDEADAIVLTRRLALGIERSIDDDAIKEMVGITGGMPYLIHELSLLLHYDDKNQVLHQPITAADVRKAFTAFIEDTNKSHAVTQFVSKIPDYYKGDDTKLAYAILDWVAQDPPSWQTLADLPVDIREHERFLPVYHNLILDQYIETRNDGQEIRWRYDFIRVIYRRYRLLKRRK